MIRGVTRSALGLLAAALIASACGGGATTGGAATASGAQITVTLTDNSIVVDSPSLAPGKVTFTVVNKGTVVHSLVLLKTDVPQDKIPADAKDAAKVSETGSVAATGQIPVGATKSFVRDLAAGAYVLVCNEPAHYLVGMHTALAVK